MARYQLGGHLLQSLGRRQFTFPDNIDVPAECTERPSVLRITPAIVADLRPPVHPPGPDLSRTVDTTPTTVPKAAMYEHAGAQPRKDEVRSAREIRAVKPVSETERMQRPPDLKLWLGVDAAYPAHVLTSALSAELIHKASVIPSSRPNEPW